MKEARAVDGQNPAPPKKSWNDYSLKIQNKQRFQPWFPTVTGTPLGMFAVHQGESRFHKFLY